MNRIGLGMAVAGLAVCVCAGARAQDVTPADKTFVEDAQQGNYAEIAMARLALEKSKDPNVRRFAERMIHDHEMLNSQLKRLAAKLHIREESGPSIVEKAKYEELKLKSGQSFDYAYVEAMVKDHNDDLQKFIDEENSAQNPELKATVQKAEQVVKEHTEMIDGIAHLGGIQTPPMPSGA